MVVLAYPADGSECELTDAARTIGLSPSTMHRYTRAWVALGVLEQDPDSRRYRRVRDGDAYSEPRHRLHRELATGRRATGVGDDAR
jgi:IclR-like helix-turn-helix domain-containing protein